MRFTVAIGLVLAAAVAANSFYYFYPCYFHSCVATENVFLLSKEKEKRDFAAQAVILSRKRFARLFTHEITKGSLLLDKNIEEPPVIRFQSKWFLRFDPFKPKTLSEVLSNSELAKGVKFIRPEYASMAMAEHGMTGPILGDRREVTKHELCHMFFSSSMRGSKFSDAMDEIAAISCESDKSINSRVRRFKLLAAKGVEIPWDKFLVMRHPIKRRNKLVGLLSEGVKRSGGSVRFNIDNKSELGQEIDLFYAQSAAFVSVWEIKCPNQQVLSRLAISLSRETTFSAWLANNGLKCSPRTIGQFDVAVNQILQG